MAMALETSIITDLPNGTVTGSAYLAAENSSLTYKTTINAAVAAASAIASLNNSIDTLDGRIDATEDDIETIQTRYAGQLSSIQGMIDLVDGQGDYVMLMASATSALCSALVGANGTGILLLKGLDDTYIDFELSVSGRRKYTGRVEKSDGSIVMVSAYANAQRGNVSTLIPAGNAYVDVSVTFGMEFPGTPTVMLTPYTNTTAQTNVPVPVLIAVSSTGFSMRVWRQYGSGTTTNPEPTIYWVATYV